MKPGSKMCESFAAINFCGNPTTHSFWYRFCVYDRDGCGAAACISLCQGNTLFISTPCGGEWLLWMLHPASKIFLQNLPRRWVIVMINLSTMLILQTIQWYLPDTKHAYNIACLLCTYLRVVECLLHLMPEKREIKSLDILSASRYDAKNMFLCFTLLAVMSGKSTQLHQIHYAFFDHSLQIMWSCLPQVLWTPHLQLNQPC